MTGGWQYYTGPGGRETVLKEIEKAGLSDDELGRLEELMTRAAEGRLLPNDITHLGRGLSELRLYGDRRIFRLVFSKVDGGLIFLALCFFGKKRDRARNEIQLAAGRLRDWNSR